MLTGSLSSGSAHSTGACLALQQAPSPPRAASSPVDCIPSHAQLPRLPPSEFCSRLRQCPGAPGKSLLLPLSSFGNTSRKTLPFEARKRPTATPNSLLSSPENSFKKPSSSAGSPLISFLIITPLASGATGWDHTAPTSELFRERATDYACARPGRGRAAIFAYFTLLTSVRIPANSVARLGLGVGYLSENETVEDSQMGL